MSYQTYLRSTNATHLIPLKTFLLLTFGGAWLIWSPLLVAEYLRLMLPVPSIVLITLGSFAPTITALLLTWRYAGGTEVVILTWAAALLVVARLRGVRTQMTGE